MPTAVPPVTFSLAGPVAPAENAILSGRLSDLSVAFGGNLNVTNLSTPQGQIASSDSAIIGDCNDSLLFLSGQFDPATASGRWQDGLANIYFLTRNPAQSTAVQVVCTGVGAVIPVGALIQAADGNIYAATEAGILPGGAGGSITLPFACQVTGPIQCPPQTFEIYRAISGWDTAISSVAGAIGNAVESRIDFENRRELSVAQNAQGSAAAVLGAVLSLPGVLDAYVYDNGSLTSTTVGGVTIPANTLYVAATGGIAQSVAEAIWTKRGSATPTMTLSSTTETVYDTSGGSMPYPAYSISYTIPTPTPIYFSVTITNGPSVPSNALALIRGAITNAFVGGTGTGGPRARIGGAIYASRYYAPVAALGAWAANLVDIYIGLSASPGSGNSVTMQINQQPTILSANISLTLV